MTGTNNFAVKKLLAVDDTTNNYLVYCPLFYEKPEDNWLLDIEMYSEEFRADLISIWMDELGIPSTPAMRKQVKDYRKYFNAKTRRDKIASQSKAPTVPVQLHMAVMGALGGLKDVSPAAIMKEVLKAGMDINTNYLYREFVNYGADKAFWSMVKQGSGYEAEQPDIAMLATHMLLTATTRTMRLEYLAGLDSFISSPHQAFCFDFISDWLHAEDQEQLIEIAKSVEDELKLPQRFIQMPHVEIDQLKEGRKRFTEDEWLDIMMRSIGMEPDTLNEREKWLLLLRMVPLVENNFNLCELGPRSTGKSHLYKEISPNSILVSGGQTTVANLFYNMGRKTVGLVGLWDCVAFDEVAGINFKDKDGIQIMKDYMASGSFARGKEEKAASASMVFVGNINQSVDVMLKTSSLFDPFPPEMGTDTAFLDRMHCYIPGWEITKFRPEHFTNDYGFITDYLAELLRELRKEQYGDALDEYFRLGRNLNQRDTIAVRKMVGGLVKLMYPDGEYTKEQLEEILKISLEMRRRVKEQLKKLGGMEFYDVNFSYIDLEDMSEHYVSVPEQGGGKLIPEGLCNPGQVYTVSQGKSGMIGVFRLEGQMLPGNGKLERTGLGSDRDAKESSNTAFNYLKANGNRISGSISTTSKDYIINYQDLQGIGMTGKLALPTLIALCSIALGRPVQSSTAILGEISISGTLIKVDNLADTLQVCLDSGAKKVLLPQTSFVDFATVPLELMSAFQLIPYQSAEDAVFKALGVE